MKLFHIHRYKKVNFFVSYSISKEGSHPYTSVESFICTCGKKKVKYYEPWAARCVAVDTPPAAQKWALDWLNSLPVKNNVIQLVKKEKK